VTLTTCPNGHRDVVLDTTGPSITITSPAPEGRVFDTAATSAITYLATDAASVWRGTR
jgi:hypothetical protein